MWPDTAASVSDTTLGAQMAITLDEPPETPRPAMILPDDACHLCGTTNGPLSPGRPQPAGPGVERETAVCTSCLAKEGIDQ